MAHSQDIALEFDPSVVDHLGEAGYRPEFGARELRRQIRQLIENALAKEMLKGEIAEGARVMCRYDGETARIVFDAERRNAEVKEEQGTPQTP